MADDGRVTAVHSAPYSAAALLQELLAKADRGECQLSPTALGLLLEEAEREEAEGAVVDLTMDER